MRVDHNECNNEIQPILIPIVSCPGAPYSPFILGAVGAQFSQGHPCSGSIGLGGSTHHVTSSPAMVITF